MRSAVVLLAGCVVGPPPGFSRGDRWTFPLVDPLAGGALVTPVSIHGRGPWLFALDPDAPRTTLEVGLLDEPITDVRIGDLTVSSLTPQLEKQHVFDTGGRRIRGVIGRDVLADSLVFGYDRDRGVAWVVTEDAFHPPAGARVIEWNQARGKRGAIVDAAIDGAVRPVRVTLTRASELRDRGGLQPRAASVELVDEPDPPRHVDDVAVARRVIVQGIERGDIAFAPFQDPQYAIEDTEGTVRIHEGYDGTIGLDFFLPFAVAADWPRRRMYLTAPAGVREAAATRLARWPNLACADNGCAKVVLAGSVQLDARYAGAHLDMIDASPYPRQCAEGGACVAPMDAAPP